VGACGIALVSQLTYVMLLGLLAYCPSYAAQHVVMAVAGVSFPRVAVVAVPSQGSMGHECGPQSA